MYSCKWRFKFNISKSNVIVVAGRKKQAQIGNYFLGLEALKVVKVYKYLGLDFEDSLRWTLTRQRLVAKARVRVALLSKALSEGLSPQAGEVIWWAMIVPVLNFGSELWGAAKCKEIERVQLEVGKRILGISKKTASAVVRGELGWWSMRAQRDMKILLFWARLVRMHDTRLVKQVYLLRRQQAGRRAGGWCAAVKKLLESIGLGHVWESEAVGSVTEWKRLIKHSLQSREEMNWKEEMKMKPKLRTYRSLKYDLRKEEYLEVIKDKEERRKLTALRGGTNPLRIETGRWKGESVEDRICSLCAEGKLEDEKHFLLFCSAYHRERQQLFKHIKDMTNYDIPLMLDQQQWALEMLLGVGCSDKTKRQCIQLEVAKFIDVAFRKRWTLIMKVTQD